MLPSESKYNGLPELLKYEDTHILWKGMPIPVQTDTATPYLKKHHRFLSVKITGVNPNGYQLMDMENQRLRITDSIGPSAEPAC